MTYYWLYSRLGLHVGQGDEQVRDAFAEYADEAIGGGRAVLKEEHYLGVLKEHHDAQRLYADVMSGGLR